MAGCGGAGGARAVGARVRGVFFQVDHSRRRAEPEVPRSDGVLGVAAGAECLPSLHPAGAGGAGAGQ